MGYTELEPRGRECRLYLAGGEDHSCRLILAGFLFLFLLVFPQQSLFAQRKSDLGLIAGSSYYLGDLNPTRHFYAPSFAGGVIARYNLNPRNSFRFSGIYGSVRVGDLGPDVANGLQDPSSFNSRILDLAFTTEFNFMPYATTKIRKERYTPYVTGGVGYMVRLSSEVETEPTITLAFGGGFKYNLSVRFGVGLEWTFRKAFSDLVDVQENPGQTNNVFFHNKDWYSIVGVFVTYKIFDWREDCPAYD